MRSILFYESASGRCPVQEFLDGLDGKQAQKVIWVLQLIRELPRPPTKFFKKLVGTDLWEVRADRGGHAFRLLGFMDGERLVVLTSAFQKKTPKTPKQEIQTALKRKRSYTNRKGKHDGRSR